MKFWRFSNFDDSPAARLKGDKSIRRQVSSFLPRRANPRPWVKQGLLASDWLQLAVTEGRPAILDDFTLRRKECGLISWSPAANLSSAGHHFRLGNM